MPSAKNIVVIGGGTGVYTVLSGLKRHPHNLTAIVSMADDGGSTGVLREEFGILPPGDIRRALVALSDHKQEFLAELFNYRFSEGKSLEGHSFGNLFITALERIHGDFEKAVEEAGRILKVSGRVIPVTLDNTRLHAELENGEVVRGEHNIDVPQHNPELRIKRVFLDPTARANRNAVEAIREAHLVIIGPGDLYTSIIPNLLVRGIPEALGESEGKKVYVCNVMTKLGETHGFRAIDFVNEIEKYTREDLLDVVLLNKHVPSRGLKERYFKEERAEPVSYTLRDFASKNLKAVEGNLLRKGSFIRHDPRKLANHLVKLV